MNRGRRGYSCNYCGKFIEDSKERGSAKRHNCPQKRRRSKSINDKKNLIKKIPKLEEKIANLEEKIAKLEEKILHLEGVSLG